MNDDFMERFRDELLEEEGFVQGVYPDPILGWDAPTAGCGHLLTKDDDPKDPKWEDREYLLKLLEIDMTNAIRDCENTFTRFHSLPEDAQLVLSGLSYQLGWTRLNGFKNMIRAVETGDWRVAAVELLDSKYAREDVPARARRYADRLRACADVPLAPLKDGRE